MIEASDLNDQSYDIRYDVSIVTDLFSPYLTLRFKDTEQTKQFNCNDQGNHDVLVEIIDANNNSTEGTGNITVIDPNNYCALSSQNVGRPSPLKVYPKPAQHPLNINAVLLITMFQLYDNVGNIVTHQNPRPTQINADISRLAPGLYYIVAHTPLQMCREIFVKR